MGRLIDADAMKAKCGDWYTEEGPEEGFIGTLGALLDLQPDIEAVPIKLLANWLAAEIGYGILPLAHQEHLFNCGRMLSRELVAEEWERFLREMMDWNDPESRGR